MDEPVRILVSSCLLGNNVRYDRGHKRDDFLAEIFAGRVAWVPVCPEVECGLPTPREAMRLEGISAAPRLVGILSGIDYTVRMAEWARRRVGELAALRLSGYICKSGSPSSGMRGVPVHDGRGVPAGASAGLFTKAFMERFPRVPVEDEERLRDPVILDRFLERVFAP